MGLVEKLLPPEASFGFTTDRPGPVEAEEFERWPQDPDRPLELIEGWVMPMSPGDFPTGQLLWKLPGALRGLVEERGWQMALDARHRLPQPPGTVVFPDLALHCVAEVTYLPGRKTVSRVPDLVIELLGEETAGRDRGPRGAKFLAYQMSGVREYFSCWPDGREAAGFHLQGEHFVPLVADASGFFESTILGARLRLVPPALER
jgi:Uma2 family endonuclease